MASYDDYYKENGPSVKPPGVSDEFWAAFVRKKQYEDPNGAFGVDADKLGMSDEELSGYISNLLKGLGTQQSQAENRASELTTGAPLATQLAAQRGVQYNTAIAGEQGIAGLQQAQSGANRGAWRSILDARLKKYGIDTQADIAEGDPILQFLSTIGQGVGYGYGANLFGGK